MQINLKYKKLLLEYLKNHIFVKKKCKIFKEDLSKILLLLFFIKIKENKFKKKINDIFILNLISYTRIITIKCSLKYDTF